MLLGDSHEDVDELLAQAERQGGRAERGHWRGGKHVLACRSRVAERCRVISATGVTVRAGSEPDAAKVKVFPPGTTLDVLQRAPGKRGARLRTAEGWINECSAGSGRLLVEPVSRDGPPPTRFDGSWESSRGHLMVIECGRLMGVADFRATGSSQCVLVVREKTYHGELVDDMLKWKHGDVWQRVQRDGEDSTAKRIWRQPSATETKAFKGSVDTESPEENDFAAESPLESLEGADQSDAYSDEPSDPSAEDSMNAAEISRVSLSTEGTDGSKRKKKKKKKRYVGQRVKHRKQVRRTYVSASLLKGKGRSPAHIEEVGVEEADERRRSSQASLPDVAPLALGSAPTAEAPRNESEYCSQCSGSKRRTLFNMMGLGPLSPCVLCQPIAQSRFEVMDLDGFETWRASNVGGVAHLKGFCDGMRDYYTTSALKRLEAFSLVAWGGEPPAAGGFTRLVEPFLLGSPDRKAVAFVEKDDVDRFQESWGHAVSPCLDRIIVVELHLAEAVERFNLVTEAIRVADWSQEACSIYFAGRVAIKATASKQVIAFGGAGILGQEAEASFADGARWTIYALSRGMKETEASLMDWAAVTERENVTLVYWKDPSYADCFANIVPSVNRMEVVDLAAFSTWRDHFDGELVHLRGFGAGTVDCSCGMAALDQLSSYSVVAWTGEPEEDSGYTSLGLAFLRGAAHRRAAVFLSRSAVPSFRARWQEVAGNVAHRIVAVTVDVEADATLLGLLTPPSPKPPAGRCREQYLLGRLALQAASACESRPAHVISLGGAGAALSLEVETSLAEGARWTIYTIERASRAEEVGTLTMLEWAATKTEVDPNLMLLSPKAPYGLCRPCQKCSGTGTRGLFGPTGLGVASRTCNACKGTGTIPCPLVLPKMDEDIFAHRGLSQE